MKTPLGFVQMMVFWILVFSATILAQDEGPKFTEDFLIDDCVFSDRVEAFGQPNPYFILEPGWWIVLEGEEENDEGEMETVRVEITVLDETRLVYGVLTRVVEEREFIDGELAEVSRNFYAICLNNNDVYYFGEDVDDYEDGQIVGHEGVWLAGENDAEPGVIMPGSILLGARYMQEIAEEDEALDRGEIKDLIDVELAGKQFEDVAVIEDTNALEPEEEGDIKYFAPGIGQIKDAEAELVEYGWKFTTPSRWMPHVTRFAGGFQTHFRFMNDSPTTVEMILTPYLADGQALDAVTVSIPGGTTHVVNSGDLFGASEVSHFAIQGPTECVVYSTYRATSGVSSIAEVREAGLPYYSFSFFEGEWGTAFFDGMALVNLGGGPAAITAKQISPEGTLIEEETLHAGLAVNAKQLVVLSDFFDNHPGSTIEISADQPLNATVLRGTLANQQVNVLWTIPTIATNRTPAGSSGGETLVLEDAKLIIEHNATDEDTGFQGFADGDPWNVLQIIGPGGEVVDIDTEGSFVGFGLTELFFETSEPENADVPIADVLARLPEGEYLFKATMIDGTESNFVTNFTHTIPAGPELVAPEDGAENVDPANLVVSWNPVTETINGSAVNIVGYQVIVETNEQPMFPKGFAQPVFSLYVPATVTSVSVPQAFMEAGKAYEYEVLAIEESGNQTLSSAEFFTGQEIEVEDPEEEPSLKAAKLLIEHNGADEDTGFQGFADGDPWDDLEIAGPGGEIINASPEGSLSGFGLTEFFFETSEPENAVTSIDNVLAVLPEGEYTFTGEIVEAEDSDLTTEFTHRIPAVPELLMPEEEAEDVDPANVVITWSPVTETLDGSGDITIVGYQVIVEAEEDPFSPQGFARAVFSVYLPATATTVTVPAEFMKPDTDYEFEVLAIEESGNQTLNSGEFSTAE